MKIVITKVILFTLILGLVSSCESPKTKSISTTDNNAHLGEIDIEISCAPDANKMFQEGLLLLHSFQFDDAGEKFHEAQQLDSLCAMAYWGEAMSQNHPLWREQDKEKALSILARLGPSKEDQRKAFKLEFEQDMFDAICILYGEGPKKGNDIAYSTFMEDLHKKYPKHHEVQAFYALSLLGAIEDDRTDDLYHKGAKIAQSIIEENPQHPGALHYLIHSYDDPDNAHKALDAANRYAKVAPDAAHALHMPSHIYVALGKWDEVISSNIAAVAASIDRKEKKDLPVKAIDFHSLKWQMYGHLQKGEFEKARTLVKQMESYCQAESSPKAVSHNVMMKAAYFSETNKWVDELLKDDIDYADVPVQIHAARSYMLGMAAFHNEDKGELKNIINEMTSVIAAAKKKAMLGTPEMCSASYDRRRPTLNHVNRAKVMQLQLEAQVAILEEKTEKTEALIKQAMEVEESTTYKYGPPEIVKPTHEMYAEWLYKQNRFEEANTYFLKVLERSPGRYIPTQMLAKLNQVGAINLK